MAGTVVVNALPMTRNADFDDHCSGAPAAHGSSQTKVSDSSPYPEPAQSLAHVWTARRCTSSIRKARVAEPQVLAIVLTFDAPGALDRCLAAIAAQTRPPNRVLVIDNASPVPARPATIDLPVELLRATSNSGPAGGHADGIERFLESGMALAWIMDDDCVPAPRCLEHLVRRHDELETDSLILPWWIDVVTGEGTFHPAWCGFLMSREVIERIGLPRRDLVWWSEDTEYLAWRRERAGIPVVCDREAVVEHRRIRVAASRPAWKVYYEVRNTLYLRLFVQRTSTPARLWRLTRSLAKIFAEVLLGSHRGKDAKLAAYARGVFDGLTGRLGLRVALGDGVE